MIYTTYFANLKNLPGDIIPISICGKAPEWYRGLEYKKLAPKYDFFKKWKEDHNNEHYIKCYNEQVLDKLDMEQVLYDLFNLAGDLRDIREDIALVCYEKPSDFCHRHLVADWFRQNWIACEEWKGEKEYA